METLVRVSQTVTSVQRFSVTLFHTRDSEIAAIIDVIERQQHLGKAKGECPYARRMLHPQPPLNMTLNRKGPRMRLFWKVFCFSFMVVVLTPIWKQIPGNLPSQLGVTENELS